MRQSTLAVGLKMQASAELASTLKEQREVSDLLCRKNSPNSKIMFLSDFAESFDDAVDVLYTFLVGDLSGEEVLADAKMKAEAHDVSRWSSAAQSSSDHVHSGLEKEKAIGLWRNQTDA